MASSTAPDDPSSAGVGNSTSTPPSTEIGALLSSESVTGLMMNRTRAPENVEEPPYWSVVFDDAQLGLTVIGVLANLFTFVALFKGNKVSYFPLWQIYANSEIPISGSFETFVMFL